VIWGRESSPATRTTAAELKRGRDRPLSLIEDALGDADDPA
jgi:hypothetical protein